MIGTVAMAKMTAMLALVSRRKREISAVMRPADMAMHFLARDAETAGTLPEIVCRTLPKIPSFLLTWKWIGLAAGRGKAWEPRLVTVMARRYGFWVGHPEG